MKVITFSRFYPAYHPRKGEPTEFIEKIWKGVYEDSSDVPFPHELAGVWSAYCEMDNLIPKYHTIRAGNRWKVGDWFSPRVWSGKPYKSKQIEFAPPIQVKKVWELEIEVGKKYWFFKLNGEDISNEKENFNIDEFTELLAKNDGLLLSDFLNWFPKSFTGQIICWNDKIEY